MYPQRIGNNFLLSFFFMLVLPRCILSEDPSRCTSYPDLPTNCTNIRQCPSILNILTQFGTETNNYLQSRVCGCDDNDNPLVCCPEQLPPRTVPLNEASEASVSPQSGTETLKSQPRFSQDCDYRNYERIVDDSIGNKPQPLYKSVGVTRVGFKIKWRSMSMLGYKTESGTIQWNCGGSLISSRHVLTAAHCIDGQPNLHLVRLGEYDLNYHIDEGLSRVDVRIKKATIHPHYSTEKMTNDVGVLTLERDVVISDGLIQPICLPIFDHIRTMNLTGKFAYSAGWGIINQAGTLPTSLQEIHIPVWPEKQCYDAYSRLKSYTGSVDGRTICAGEPGGQMPCAGDSGGPLILEHQKKFYVVGVVSHGTRVCSQPGFPEVFVRVSEYLDFILSQLI